MMDIKIGDIVVISQRFFFEDKMGCLGKVVSIKEPMARLLMLDNSDMFCLISDLDKASREEIELFFWREHVMKKQKK